MHNVKISSNVYKLSKKNIEMKDVAIKGLKFKKYVELRSFVSLFSNNI
jgi:hypothetical protein